MVVRSQSSSMCCQSSPPAPPPIQLLAPTCNLDRECYLDSQFNIHNCDTATGELIAFGLLVQAVYKMRLLSAGVWSATKWTLQMDIPSSSHSHRHFSPVEFCLHACHNLETGERLSSSSAWTHKCMVVVQINKHLVIWPASLLHETCCWFICEHKPANDKKTGIRHYLSTFLPTYQCECAE